MPGFQKTDKMDQQMVDFFNQTNKRLHEIEKTGITKPNANSIVNTKSSGLPADHTHSYLTSLAGAILENQGTHQTLGSDAERLLKLYATDIYSTGANIDEIDIGDTGMFKLLSLTVNRTTGGITVQDKELWILANATYNSSDGCFYRVDNTATAFGLQIQGKGTIPGEEAISTINQGYVIWRCTPNTGTPTDKIGALSGGVWTTFGVYYGWELGFLFDSFRNLVIGGFGIEIDGSGTFPFGRIIHELTSGTGWGQRFTGILTNLYAQINGGQDDGTKPSWFAGIEDDSFVVKRRAAAANPILYSELIELIKITNTQVNINKPVIPFKMTTTEKNALSSPVAGMIIYDTTLNKLCIYTTAWETLTSS